MLAEEGLIAILSAARTLGTLGSAPVDTVIRHALGFAHALDGVSGTVLDLGTGAGVPGLIVAAARPDLRLVLVDRRAARIDALTRGIRRQHWGDRIEALCADVSGLVGSAVHEGQYAAAVSRGFGPPEETLRYAARAVADGGRVVISEPPQASGSRWDGDTLLAAGGTERRISPPERRGAVAVFHVEHRRA